MNPDFIKQVKEEYVKVHNDGDCLIKIKKIEAYFDKHTKQIILASRLATIKEIG